MTDRELMQQALEALELLAWCENPATRVQVRKPRNGGRIVTVYPHKVATEAAAPLRERLAQPEQEPVAWADMNVRGEDKGLSWTPGHFHTTPLYTTPPKREWQCLTDKERNSLWLDVIGWGDPSHDDEDLMKAIEAKLREKNA